VRRLLLRLALLGCLPALGGCGLGAGTAPRAVQLLVTRDFGTRVLHTATHPKTAGQETVMSLLLRNYPVKTRYGGGFVEAIGNLSGGSEAGHSVDWFYYVNGVEASKGAAATDVHPGDHIWWDRHDWSQTEDVPAVVGSFPEPFLNGLEGKRLPVRVECATGAQSACTTVSDRLQAVGVPAATSAIAPEGESQTLRVLVGPWPAVRGDVGVAGIEKGPRTSGVYATFDRDGSNLTLLGQDGQHLQVLSGSAGLIAATRQGEEAPAWVVTGTDEAGVQAAAKVFDAASLHNRFAVAVAAGSVIPLPEPVR
jgi:Domain of unknown function (DUF4430)